MRDDVRDHFAIFQGVQKKILIEAITIDGFSRKIMMSEHSRDFSCSWKYLRRSEVWILFKQMSIMLNLKQISEVRSYKLTTFIVKYWLDFNELLIFFMKENFRFKDIVDSQVQA